MNRIYANILNYKNSYIFQRQKTKLALVVRSDIKMTKGKTAAQCAHAAVLCYQKCENCEKKKILINKWCSDGQPKIVLKINNFKEMEILQNKSKEAGINTVLVRDAGHTQLIPGTVTVLGIGPATTEDINKLVSHLKLL